jgi:hypothetical protein
MKHHTYGLLGSHGRPYSMDISCFSTRVSNKELGENKMSTPKMSTIKVTYHWLRPLLHPWALVSLAKYPCVATGKPTCQPMWEEAVRHRVKKLRPVFLDSHHRVPPLVIVASFYWCWGLPMPATMRPSCGASSDGSTSFLLVYVFLVNNNLKISRVAATTVPPANHDWPPLSPMWPDMYYNGIFTTILYQKR